VVDYTEEASAAVERWAEAGMRVVRSAESIDRWPGIEARRAAATR
jgi:hypothetical protein